MPETVGATAGLLRRCTFPPPGSEAPLAVSGGADSLAMLALAVASGCRAVAYHVDHGLRPGSESEADVVAEAAARFGAGFVSLQVSVPPGGNLEARARVARFGVLPAGVATGHTADDQAETVLLNLLRGAGPDGLAGMRPGHSHPILALRRSETRSLCATLALCPVEDPSNSETGYLRNHVRHDVLPALCALAKRDLVPILTRQAQHFADESDLLDELAAALDPTDARGLATAPVVLARRAIRGWLRNYDEEGHPPDSATVERVLHVARLGASACEVGGGRRVGRSAGKLFVEPD
ncbi:MAG: tRNA lysidine(34) synthetase TilS [Acidimicrobiales bacterium]|jgi:tRNA(Ile)-lysidine synthase